MNQLSMNLFPIEILTQIHCRYVTIVHFPCLKVKLCFACIIVEVKNNFVHIKYFSIDCQLSYIMAIAVTGNPS